MVGKCCICFCFVRLYSKFIKTITLKVISMQSPHISHNGNKKRVNKPFKGYLLQPMSQPITYKNHNQTKTNRTKTISHWVTSVIHVIELSAFTCTCINCTWYKMVVTSLLTTVLIQKKYFEYLFTVYSVLS